MVGRCIQDQAVCIRQHHPGNHATHLFTSGQYANLFQQFFTREQHTAEETFQEYFVSISGELAQPVDQVIIGIEIFGIIQRQIGRCDRLAPLESTGFRLFFSVDNLEEGSHGTRVAADEYNLVVLFYVEVQIFEQNLTFDAFRQSFHFENLVARFAVRGKDNTRVTA